MKIELSDNAPEETDADLLCVGLFDDEELPAYLIGAPGAEDAESKLKSLAVVRPGGKRVLVVGLGKRDDFDTERARVAAALGVRQAGRFDASHIAWVSPAEGGAAAGLTSGTILASYRFDRYKSKPGENEEGGPPDVKVERLTLHGAGDAAAIVETARVASLAANRARDLQNLPANVADPAFLADRAREIAAAHDALEVEVLGRSELEAEGMGGILAVSQGSAKEPQLIVLRYAGGGSGSTLGLVGKGVTFDSGGISIKPSAGMELMKKDMSGGAAVLEATAAIAELGLPVDLVTVVPAVENMPSGTAMRPGDIITQLNGKTVEINNTDAEGRLILADALTWCERHGAERIVDVATLTGAVVVALGSTYAGLMANDDEWAEELTAAGDITGELLWRLPLHPEYKQLTKGTAADLTNAAAKRKAGTIYAGSFLEEFVEEATWAHLDIAGTSWDVGREYVGSGATGFGVRLLVELTSRLASAER